MQWMPIFLSHWNFCECTKDLTCVNSLVILEVRGSTECLATEITLVILFSSVNPSVYNQTVLALEVFATKFTLVLPAKNIYLYSPKCP